MPGYLIPILLAIVAVILLIGVWLLWQLLRRQGRARSADALQLMQQELHQTGAKLDANRTG